MKPAITPCAPTPPVQRARFVSTLFLRAAVALLAAGALGACAVGPDYQRPEVRLPTTLEGEPAGAALAPMPGASAPAAATPAASAASAAQALQADWWKRFGSPKLDHWVEQALARNPGIEAGQAALRAALEGVRAQTGAYYPQIGASYGFLRQQTESQLASPLANSNYIFNLHTAQLSLSYTPDVFGLNRRAVESLRAAADSQSYTLAATRITLAANVVVAAATEAALRAQLQAAQAQVQLQTQLVDALTRMRGAGAAGETDVLAQEATLDVLLANVTTLSKSLEVTRDMLKNLAGGYPADTLGDEFELSDFQIPADLPATLPSSLLENRPDVRVAEENLHIASAAIGMARANRLPQFTLGAVYGQSSTEWNSLFNSENAFWALSGGFMAPIFAGGALEARENQARSYYDQAAAQYRQTVLAAFQGVADALSALRNDRVAAKRLARAAEVARRMARIGEAQNQLGDVSAISVINLRAQALLADAALAQAQGQWLADIAALCQALGGGWSDRGPTLQKD